MIGANRSQPAVLSPSLRAESKFAVHSPTVLHANCAGATTRRIAPRPTNAEEPNVARSLEPSTLKVSVEAGSRASELTVTSAVCSDEASAGTFLNAGVA